MLNAIPRWGDLISINSISICQKCKEQIIRINVSINGIYCLFEYNEFMKQYFYRYKFLKDIYLAHVFAKEINHFFINEIKKHQDWIITPIPIHYQHLKERTFSQVEELLTTAFVRHQQVLKKISTKRQSQKSRDERLQTTKLFDVITNVKGESFLVFDDIKTTGTTLKLAEEALMSSGAKEVRLIALAGHDR